MQLVVGDSTERFGTYGNIVCHLPQKLLDSLDAYRGDYILVKSKAQQLILVVQDLQSDNVNSIFLHKLERKELGVSLGDVVEIEILGMLDHVTTITLKAKRPVRTKNIFERYVRPIFNYCFKPVLLGQQIVIGGSKMKIDYIDGLSRGQTVPGCTRIKLISCDGDSIASGVTRDR